jgi:hypothetical protein
MKETKQKMRKNGAKTRSDKGGMTRQRKACMANEGGRREEGGGRKEEEC